MKLYYLNENVMKDFKMNIEFNFSHYLEEDNSFFDNYAKKELGIAKPFLLFKKEIPDDRVNEVMNKYYPEYTGKGFSLKMTKPDNPVLTDADNIKLLYSLLKDFVSDSDASYETFWSGLAHSVFFDYMKYRNSMKNDKSDEKKYAYINNNYFFAKKHYQYRNDLAKLYWIGKAVYDKNEENKDPFYLIDYLKDDFSSAVAFIFSYKFFNNIKILKAFLLAINEKQLYKKYTREDYRSVFLAKILVFINILAGTYCIDDFEEEELKNRLCNYIDKIESEHSKIKK